MKACFCLIFLLILPLFTAAQIVLISENDKKQIIELIFKDYNFDGQNIATNKPKISVNLSAKHILPKMITNIDKVNIVLVSEKDISKMVTSGGEYYYLSEFEAKDDSSVKVTFGKIGIAKETGNGTGNYWKYQCRKVLGKWELQRDFGGNFHLFY